MVLGLVFLVIKVFEYKHKWDLQPRARARTTIFEARTRPQVEIFISLYFALTGLHALHMVIGFVLLSRDRLDGAQGPVLAGVVHAGRDVGSLLALRRHRLDLPVPAALSGGQGAPASDKPCRTSHPRARTYTIFGTLMVLTAITVSAAFTQPRLAELSGRHRHRDHQGHARHPVLHAREVQQQADQVAVASCVLLPGVPVRPDVHRLLSRGWFTSPRGTTMAGTQVTVGRRRAAPKPAAPRSCVRSPRQLVVLAERTVGSIAADGFEPSRCYDAPLTTNDYRCAPSSSRAGSASDRRPGRIPCPPRAKCSCASSAPASARPTSS